MISHSIPVGVVTRLVRQLSSACHHIPVAYGPVHCGNQLLCPQQFTCTYFPSLSFGNFEPIKADFREAWNIAIRIEAQLLFKLKFFEISTCPLLRFVGSVGIG